MPPPSERSDARPNSPAYSSGAPREYPDRPNQQHVKPPPTEAARKRQCAPKTRRVPRSTQKERSTAHRAWSC